MDPYGPKRRKSVAFVVARSAFVAESLKDLGDFSQVTWTFDIFSFLF